MAFGRTILSRSSEEGDRLRFNRDIPSWLNTQTYTRFWHLK